MQQVTQYTIVQDDNGPKYYALSGGTVIGSITMLDPMGGPGSYTWAMHHNDLHGSAPSLQSALAFIILAAGGWTDDILTIEPRESYARPHMAGAESEPLAVADLICRLLNMMDRVNRNVVNTGYGTLSSQVEHLKLHIIARLKDAGWRISHPRQSYRVEIPANRNPDNWMLRSTMEDK